MVLGSTQLLTEMSTRNLKDKLEGKVRPARRADNLAAISTIAQKRCFLRGLCTVLLREVNSEARSSRKIQSK
jgi:hypothetical protein